MGAEDWVFGLDPSDSDGPEPPWTCRFCDGDIWWIDSQPFDDDEGEKPHVCPNRIAAPSDFPRLDP